MGYNNQIIWVVDINVSVYQHIMHLIHHLTNCWTIQPELALGNNMMYSWLMVSKAIFRNINQCAGISVNTCRSCPRSKFDCAFGYPGEYLLYRNYYAATATPSISASRRTADRTNACICEFSSRASTVSMGVGKSYRTILTIGKHIVAQQSLPRGYQCIGIDESAQFGIVITGLEIVERGLSVVYIATTPNEANNLLLVVFV